ncbi:MAG: hypothetical protein ACOYNC_19455, partial [Bacteroidales bacterium]
MDCWIVDGNFIVRNFHVNFQNGISICSFSGSAKIAGSAFATETGSGVLNLSRSIPISSII